MPSAIYLDHHATTPVDPRVAALVMHTMTTAFGNANSTEHMYGEEAAHLVAQARREIGLLLDAHPNGVHFTSGASESIRMALAHAIDEHPERTVHIAVTTVEHRALLDAVATYEHTGRVIVHWLPVDEYARLDLAVLEHVCSQGVDLVCVMAANNEVGTIYPIEVVAHLATQAGAKILVDGTQAAGRVPLQSNAFGISYLIISAHKMYGPKGVGALIVPTHIDMHVTHEGTPNVPGIVGLGEACRLRRLEMGEDELQIAAKRDKLALLLQNTIQGIVINGDPENRLSHNLHFAVPDVPNDVVIARLRRYVALSSGSACMSGAQTGSHVLRAMRLSTAIQEGSLRLGLGKFTTDTEIEMAASYITDAITATRATLQAVRN